MAPYIMLHGKRVFIEEIHSVESRLFWSYYDTSDGEITIKIKSRCLEKALDFCEERAEFRRQYSSLASMVYIFDLKFLKDVKKSSLDLIDLINAAGKLGINNLVNLLFNDVFDIICKKPPEELEKIFKVRYNGEEQVLSLINLGLDLSPPCPTLSYKQQEEMKLNREEILKATPDEFKTLTDPKKRYWVYAHLVIKRNPATFIATNLLSKEDAAEDEKSEESYIMLHGKKEYIKDLYAVESRSLGACLDTSFDGKMPVQIKSRCLEKAMEFCEERAKFLKKYSSMASVVYCFDLKFLKDVKKSGLNLIDLIHAAGKLGIHNLVNLLFDDVFCILCDKDPEQLGKIFKVRYNGKNLCYSLINELLNDAPPCPTLSKEQQEEMKLNREEILKASPAEFKTLTDLKKRYWVYAHLVIKCNTAMFIEIHEDAEDAAKDDEKEDDEEESKVPKDDDDVGGP